MTRTMKTFFFCVLTFVVVHSAPTANLHQNIYTALKEARRDLANTNKQSVLKYSEDMYILRSIIVTVKKLKTNLSETILNREVINVFQNITCNRKALCLAKNVLSHFKASDLGLQDAKDWMLPRLLRVYTNKAHCTNTSKQDEVPLRQLLQHIEDCAKKEYTNHP